MSIGSFRHCARRKWLALLAFLVASGPASASDGLRYPPDALLLFVASWCAPCHAELGRLPEIGAAARPLRILVVPYDEERGTAAMLRGVPAEQIWRPDPALRERVREDLFGETAGLPFSLATNGSGRPCGSSRLGLDADRARALAAGCRT